MQASQKGHHMHWAKKDGKDFAEQMKRANGWAVQAKEIIYIKT